MTSRDGYQESLNMLFLAEHGRSQGIQKIFFILDCYIPSKNKLGLATPLMNIFYTLIWT